MKIDTVVSTSIKYGNYKKYKNRAGIISQFIEMANPYIKKEFNTFSNFQVYIRPIKGRTLGNCNRSGHIQLDPRRKSMVDCLITLSHELIHNEQYNTGRLSLKMGVDYWKGNKVDNKGSTYKAYRNQPWEKEAFKDQRKRITNILSEMTQNPDLKKKLEQMEKEW